MVIALNNTQRNKWLYRGFPPTLTLRPNLWSGLVGCWKPSLGLEQGIATLRDVSGFGNHGTMNGSMTIDDWVIGLFGYELSLDGDDDFIGVPASSSINNFTSAVTISMWIFWREVADVAVGLFESTANGSVNTRFNLFQFSDQLLYWRVIRSGDTTALTVAEPFTINTLSHIVATYVSGDQRIFHNGIQIASTTAITGSIDSGLGDNAIGDVFVAGFNMNARIADVRLYNRVLTPNEIIDIYNFPNAMFQFRDRVIGKAPVVTGVLRRNLALMGVGK